MRSPAEPKEGDAEACGGILGLLLPVSFPDTQGGPPRRAHFLDVANKAWAAIGRDLSLPTAHALVLADYRQRLAAIGNFVSALARLHYQPAAAGLFQVFLQHLAGAPGARTGVQAALEAFFHTTLRECDERGPHGELFMKRMEASIWELVAVTQHMLDFLTENEETLARFLAMRATLEAKARAAPLAVWEQPRRAPPLPAWELPPVAPAVSAVVRLRGFLGPDERTVLVHRDTSASELRALLVGVGFPCDIELVRRTPEGEAVALAPGVRVAAEDCAITVCGCEALDAKLTSTSVEDDDESNVAFSWQITRLTEESGARLLREVHAILGGQDFQDSWKTLRRRLELGSGDFARLRLMSKREIMLKYGFEASAAGLRQLDCELAGIVAEAPEGECARLLLEDASPLRLLAEPVASPLVAPRFASTASERWREHLSEHGFAILFGALGVDEAIEVAGLVSAAQAVSSSAGVAEAAIKREEQAAALRSCLGRVAALGEVLVSLRSFGLATPPPGGELDSRAEQGYHVTQGHSELGLRGVDVFVAAFNALANSDDLDGGGLAVVPASHRFHADLLASYPRGNDACDPLCLDPGDPLLEEGGSILRAMAGDVVLVDQRTVRREYAPTASSQSAALAVFVPWRPELPPDVALEEVRPCS